MADSNLSETIKSLIPEALKLSSTEYKRAQVKFETCFNKYITRTHGKYSKIKTLLYRDRPVNLNDHYVPTDFRCGNTITNGSDIFFEFKKNRRNLVLGTAGSGKSVLLRKIAIDIINQDLGFIPTLIELRVLISTESTTSISDYLHKIISTHDEDFSTDQLHYALKLGKIALLLDGIDEIDHDRRELYEKEIAELSYKYPQTIIIASSRPDDTFSSWEEFHVYHAQPLDKEQAISLIRKIDYDKTVKDKFLEQLASGLYEKHEDFLSSPLLLTMMLLTYEQLAEIPEKIHIFYEQAFDTLYHKHDALKSQYKRKSYSNLPIDDFKRIFSAF